MGNLSNLTSVLILMVGSAFLNEAGRAEENSQSATQSIMHTIFSPVSQLLPLSIDQDQFTNPKNRTKILKLMQELSDNAQGLQNHAGESGKGESFKFMSSMLARDAQEIKTWYQVGKYDEARFVLHNLTENCIACHSQWSSKKKFPGSQSFFKDVNIVNLSTLERAELEVATRQFDKALTSYEEFFGSNEFTPAQMAMMDAFTDYLKISIRVKGDLQRPIPVLEKWSKRPNVPDYMISHINDWIESLKVVGKEDFSKPSVKLAHKLIDEGRSSKQVTLHRSKLVYFISASGVLLNLVNDKKLDPKEFAEAYYLLGICESVIGRSFWVSQTEFFLEASIRSAPLSEQARESYGLLEEYIFDDFSGSSGTNVPEDVETLLKELRGLAYGPKKK